MTERIQRQCDKKLGRLSSLLLEVEAGYRLRAEMESLLREAYTILNGPVDEQARKRWLRKYHEMFRQED